MKKQLLLTLLALLPMLAMADASGSCGDHVTYTYNSTTGTLTIQGKGAMNDYNYTNPWSSFRESIKTIVIKDGVTRIGNYAFWASSGLVSVTIPNSVTSIGNCAFSSCSGLTSVTIGNSVTSIGSSAFYRCYSLTSVIIPNNVMTIGNDAFYGCTGLVSVIIGNSVTSIGSGAFRECTGLTSVTIPNSVTSIGGSAFSGCSGLTSITIPNSVTSIGNYVFSGCSGLTSITIPNSVTSIGNYAFSSCFGLTSVTIGNSVTSIGVSTFSECPKLTSVTLHCKTVNSWFSGLNSIKKVILGNMVTSIGYEAFKNCSGLTSITIPNSVTSIGGSAFYGCSGLTSVTIPNSVTSIGYFAFDGCSGLTSITIPNSVTSIGSYAFRDCSGLTSVTIPNSVTSIGNSAFSGCSDLTSATIGSSLTSIGSSLFSGCTDLNTIFYISKTPPTGWIATVNTYVPNKQSYSTPKEYINGASSSNIKQMITFDNNEFTYTGQKPTPNWTNNVEGYNAELSFPSLNINVGNYQDNVTSTFTKGSNSFVVNIPYNYLIKKVNLTVKAKNVSRLYGDENPPLSIEYTGFVNNENEDVLTTKPVGITTAKVTSPVGTYPITVSGGEATNYAFTYKQGELTVTKAALSAKVDDVTKVYGEYNPSFAISYYGLKNNEKAPAWTSQPVFQTEATRLSGVGQYVINAVNAVPVNYNLEAITSGTLTITPAALTIRANAASRKYYAENPTFNYTCSGFVNGDTQSSLSVAPSLTTTAKLSSKVGEYEIKVSGAESKNYSISYVNGTLTITPCTLRASVGNYERIYNEENPTFEVKYDGFVGNEDESVLSVKPLASTTATKTSNVGTYTIYVSGGSADNYTFTYSSGYLTINKAEQTIEWNQDLSNLKVGDQVELTASVSSGLPVSYTLLQANGAAEIYNVGNKSYLDCIKPGEFSMRAVNNGNTNYYASPRSSKTVSIKSSTGIREVNGEAKNGVSTYDTMGRKVRELKKGQLYIRQGKKFVIK